MPTRITNSAGTNSRPRRIVRTGAATLLALGMAATGSTAAGADDTLTRGVSGDAPTRTEAGQVTLLDPPQARIREAIAKHAYSQRNKKEARGNYYPIAYQKIDKKNVVRPAEWCGVFVNWAWAKGGVTDRPRMKARKGQPSIDQGHWATYWQKWGKAERKWKPISKRNPSKGDVVVYGNYPAEIAHVGVVVNVKYDRKTLKVTHVHTVEGNLSDKVKDMKWRKITQLTGRGKKATGFVSPF